MRFPVLIAALAAALPAHAQDGKGYWNVDFHRLAPTLAGHYAGTQNGQPVRFDLQDDLALGRTSTPLGLGLEYQGPRFALELALDAQNYAGTNILQQPVTISGQTWNPRATLATSIKITNLTGNWTIRFLRTPGFWWGIDLGVKGTTLDLKANGSNYLTNVVAAAAFKSTLPMPQIGPSAGYVTSGGSLAIRAYYHYLAYKGATYRHTGADLRYFPIKWVGVRAFVESEGWKVPDGSIASNLEIGLSRSGAGFGLVAKF